MTPHRLASRYLGITEFPGERHHPLIQWWLLLAGMPFGSGDEVAWCAAALNGIMWELKGVRPALPARARSWLTVGEEIKPQDATIGWDIVVLKRGGGPGPEILGAPGHVGLFDGRDEWGNVRVLGGNQSNRFSSAAYPAEQVLGYRRLGSGEV